jgi:hypothetical protein
MPSSCEVLRVVDPAHRGHFLSNSIANHQSSIPAFLGSEMMRTSSSKAAKTLAPLGQFRGLMEGRRDMERRQSGSGYRMLIAEETESSNSLA